MRKATSSLLWDTVGNVDQDRRHKMNITPELPRKIPSVQTALVQATALPCTPLVSQLIYQTRGGVFHAISKHRKLVSKYEVQPSSF